MLSLLLVSTLAPADPLTVEDLTSLQLGAAFVARDEDEAWLSAPEFLAVRERGFDHVVLQGFGPPPDWYEFVNVAETHRISVVWIPSEESVLIDGPTKGKDWVRVVSATPPTGQGFRWIPIGGSTGRVRAFRVDLPDVVTEMPSPPNRSQGWDLPYPSNRASVNRLLALAPSNAVKLEWQDWGRAAWDDQRLRDALRKSLPKRANAWRYALPVGASRHWSSGPKARFLRDVRTILREEEVGGSFAVYGGPYATETMGNGRRGFDPAVGQALGISTP